MHLLGGPEEASKRTREKAPIMHQMVKQEGSAAELQIVTTTSPLLFNSAPPHTLPRMKAVP